MQIEMPDADKKQYIITLVIETFTDRRDWIKTDNPTITDVRGKYPRLFDYNGSMVIVLNIYLPCIQNNFYRKVV